MATGGGSVELERGAHGRHSRIAAVSHDDKCVLIASESSSAALCDATTGKIITTFEGHSERICHATFASVLRPTTQISDGTVSVVPDQLCEQPIGRPYLATSSFDNTVRVWDVDTGDCIVVFADLGSGVNGVSWSPNATLLAISCGKAVRVYEAATHEAICALEGHKELVSNVAFSPNGVLLASASNDHTVRIWSMAKKTCIAVLTGPTDEINAVEFSPDGLFIAAAADDGVWIWDVNPDSIYRTADAQRAVGAPVGKKQKNKIENVAVTGDATTSTSTKAQ
jgi:WD40 repeat protein